MPSHRPPSRDSRPKRVLKEREGGDTPLNRSKGLAPIMRPFTPVEYLRAAFDRSFDEFKNICWLRIRPAVERKMNPAPNDDELSDFNTVELVHAFHRMLGQLTDLLTVTSEDPVERLGLSDRLSVVLGKVGVHLVRHLECMTFSELRGTKGIGEHLAKTIKSAMEFHGKRFREEVGEGVLSFSAPRHEAPKRKAA